MISSYQSPSSNQNANVVVPPVDAQELLDSLFIPTGDPTLLPRRDSMEGRLQPGSTFSSPITLTSSARPSHSLLLSPLQLSASTLSQSDFQSSSDCSDTGTAPRDDPANICTPSPYGCDATGSWTVGRDTCSAVLAQHFETTMPQVTDASKSLQRILGMRNEETFKLPLPLRPGPRAVAVGSVVDSNPALRHLKGSNAGLGIQIGQLGSRPGPGPGDGGARWEAAGGSQHGDVDGQGRMPEKPLTLRETLVMHGRQPYGNQSKMELRSVSFHDLTPDMRTGAFKNELLAHFEADREGQTQLVCFEVDLPVREHQQTYSSNGVVFPRTERWISFLISTPFLTFNGTAATNAAYPILPPNIPTNKGHPPTSWVIFAAPHHAVTSHPTSKDSIITQATGGAETFRTVRRHDYDFSHDGTPVFEFMNKSSILGGALGDYLDHALAAGPFLRGRGVDAYTAGWDSIRGSISQETRTEADAEEEEDGDRDAEEDGDDEEDDDDDDVRPWTGIENLERDMADSRWWRNAQARFLADQKTWARIRESMARGCCRVVSRVEEGAQLRGNQQQHQHKHQHQSQSQSQYRQQFERPTAPTTVTTRPDTARNMGHTR